MKIELTKNMIFAIQTGLAELDNSGIWSDFLTDEEVEQVEDGITRLREKI